MSSLDTQLNSGCRKCLVNTATQEGKRPSQSSNPVASSHNSSGQTQKIVKSCMLTLACMTALILGHGEFSERPMLFLFHLAAFAEKVTVVYNDLSGKKQE